MSPRAGPGVRAAMRGNPPTDEQWRAISHPPEPLAIIAGAGSGKTAIMAARMVWMVEEGLVRPSEILGLTFTNKAARELEERIIGAFDCLDPRPPELPTVATYNSFADRIVREAGVRVGMDPESALLSQAQAWQLLAESLDFVEPFEAIDSRSIASLSRSALGLADQCANNFVTPEQVAGEDRRIIEREAAYERDVLLNSRRRIELTRVVRAYQDLKQQRRCMDFGDQVTKAVEILESWAAVAEDLKQRYPAILLDEYQDTNVAQRRMLQALAPEASNVTAVGDARQNIFQWRGSTLFNLIDFPQHHFLRAGRRKHDYLSLSGNFRSGSRVVEVANAIIDHVPADRRPGLPLAPVKANGQGYVATALLADQRAEAEFIAAQIMSLHGKPATPGRAPTCWSDFAVLVRRKSHMSTIYEVLRRHEIPVEVVGLGGLLQMPEVMDVVAWLRLVADPGPSGNRWLARILLGPRYRIHYRDLAVLARWAAGRTRELSQAKRAGQPAEGVRVPDETDYEPDDVAFSLAEALDHLELIPQLDTEVLERLRRLRRELGMLRQHTADPLLELVQRIVSATGIGDALAASPRLDAASSQGNLRQFTGLVANFAPISGEPSLGEFLEYLDAAEEAEDTMELEVTPDDDSAKLTTVHGAKGLEFEVVFVPGVAAAENRKGERVYSIFPDERMSNPMTSYGQLPYGVREDATHLPSPLTVDARGNQVLKKKAVFGRELKERAVEDERRLFYVALTRARQRLYVSAAWWYERQSRPHGPSIFFDEVAALAAVENLQHAEQPAESPLLAALQARAVWPPVVRNLVETTPVLPGGPVQALEDLLDGSRDPESLLDALPAEERREAERLLEEHRAEAAVLSAAAQPAPDGPPPGRTPSLSASDAIALAAGRIDRRRLARPLPKRPSEEARIGVEVHRWIEQRARGLTGLADEEGMDAAGPPIGAGRLEQLKLTWERLYGSRELAALPGGEPMAELRFVLKLGERMVKGRIDAVYLDPGGGLEVVDFKTGGEEARPELDQLLIYAAALRRLEIPIGQRLRLSYAYLESGRVETREVDLGELDAALAGLEHRLAAAW